MEPEHIEWASEVARTALDGASPEEIRAKAREAKRRMLDAYISLFKSLSLVDQVVAVYAPDATWQWGWPVLQGAEPAPAQMPTVKRSPRTERVLQIAGGLIRQGARSVATKAIAERLMAEGVQGSLKNLTVSVGNVLARSGGWRRVGSGEYEPVNREEV